MNFYKLIKSNLKLSIFFIPFSVLLIDQIFKYLIYVNLFIEFRIIKIFPFLNLVPVWNSGISFGMFDGSGDLGRIIFTILSLSFGFIIPIYTSNWSFLERIGSGLISGGAFGNAIDRIIHGRVVDFIDFHWNEIHFPTFNFADTFISLGVAIIFFVSLKKNNLFG